MPSFQRLPTRYRKFILCRLLCPLLVQLRIWLADQDGSNVMFQLGETSFANEACHQQCFGVVSDARVYERITSFYAQYPSKALQIKSFAVITHLSFRSVDSSDSRSTTGL